MERIWLHHKETGGYFHCPAEAVETFKVLGWEPSGEPPPEVDPVVAERVAHEQHLAEQAQQATAQADEQTADAGESTTKPRRGTTPKEG